MSIGNDIFSQALGLPIADRKALALQLLDSLPEEELPLQLDPDYEAEIHRRLEEIDSGKAKMYTLEGVMAGLRKASASGEVS